VAGGLGGLCGCALACAAQWWGEGELALGAATGCENVLFVRLSGEVGVFDVFVGDCCVAEAAERWVFNRVCGFAVGAEGRDDWGAFGGVGGLGRGG
jgi:hypothetical protein